MKSLCLLPFLLLAACEVPRPMETWTPDAAGSAGKSGSGGREDEDDGDDEDEANDEESDAGASPRTDAQVMVPRPEAGGASGGGSGRRDGGTTPASGALSALEGRYLMRMDMYSTAKLPLSITIKNRVSNIMLVDFVAQGTKLVGTETLCTQTYAHVCSAKDCTMKTELLGPVLERLAKKPVQTTREYTFDAATGALSGLPATLSLGFDEDPKTKAVPSEKGDARLWKFSGGSGFCTQFDVKHPLMKVSCAVSSVLRFKKKLTGTLSKTKPVLTEDLEFTLEEAGSEGDAIDASGTPESQCNLMSLAGQAAGQGSTDVEPPREVVRFKRLDDSVTACPTDFDTQLPADPPS